MSNEQSLQLKLLTGHVLDDAEGSRRSVGESCVAYVLEGALCPAFRSSRLKDLPMFIPRGQRRKDLIRSQRTDDGGADG